MNNFLTPAMLWGDFDKNFTGKSEEKIVDGKFTGYAVTVFSEPDGDIVIDTDVYKPTRPNGNVILIVGDPSRSVQREVIERFVKTSATVVVPDYSGIAENTLTKYPPSKQYGYYDKAGEHLTKVCPTAKETSFYLYAKIIRKIIGAIKKEEPDSEIVLVGIKLGTEIALQVAGTDDRLVGLALIAGAGYRAYLGCPKYANTKVLEIEGDLIPWITGVDGTTYAKKINVPTLIAIGSNGRESDLDRVSNLMDIITAPTTLTVSSAYRDNIDETAFTTVLRWLENIYLSALPPETPTLNVKINADGEIYGEVSIDNCINIKEVVIKYSCGDNNHSTRSWDEAHCDYIGEGKYLAKLSSRGKTLLFAYPEVAYVNGTTICSGVVFCNLTGKMSKAVRKVFDPIVYQYPEEHAFVEISDDAVILKSSLKEQVIPIGLKGLRCGEGGMVTYAIGEKSGFDPSRLLRVDAYSEEKNFYLTLSVVDENNKEFTASKRVDCNDTFAGALFNLKYFKDENLKSPASWDGLRILTVVTNDVVVGRIMFI